MNDFFTNLSAECAIYLPPSELIDNFEKHIMSAAMELALSDNRKWPDWFSEAEDLLLDLIDNRNTAYKVLMKNPSETNHQKLKTARKYLLFERGLENGV